MKDIKEQLDPIFKPESIAVIGASNSARKWGFRMVNRPLKTGFRGAIYPVNPRNEKVCGLQSYGSVLDIPTSVDLAVMTIPAPRVPSAMKECAAKGVRGVILITAGFSETGEKGKAIEKAVIKIARENGIRFVGPNCMGIWSASGNVNLSFEVSPRPGPISFISQSGTFGGYLSELANSKGYGLSKFISIGNQADITASEYLSYLAEDEQTKVIVFYMEGLKDGRRFFEVAGEVVKKKPILIYKAGRTDAGSRASLSHTASIAGSEEIFDAMCKQVGIIRTSEAMQSFDMAHVLVSQPLLKGKRIAILGTGGQGVVTADACASLGLEVPPLGSDIVENLQKVMPPHAPRPTNPVDFAGSARTGIEEASVVETLLKQDSIDGVITNVPLNPIAWSYINNPGKIYKPILDYAKLAMEGAEQLGTLPRKYDKPIVTIRFRKFENDMVTGILQGAGIPVYDTPEECARAMFALAKYGATKKVTSLV